MSMSMWLGLPRHLTLSLACYLDTLLTHMPGVRLGRLALGFRGRFMLLLTNVASAATTTVFNFSSGAPSRLFYRCTSNPKQNSRPCLSATSLPILRTSFCWTYPSLSIGGGPDDIGSESVRPPSNLMYDDA